MILLMLLQRQALLLDLLVVGKLAKLLDLDALLLAVELFLLVFNVFELGMGVLDGVVQDCAMFLVLRLGLV